MKIYIKMILKKDNFALFCRLNIQNRWGSTLQKKNKVSTSLVQNKSKTEENHDEMKCMNKISSKLYSFHARLKLGPQFPKSTLVRAFVDFRVTKGLELIENNESLSTLGLCIIGYFVTEYLMSRWPRLPYKILKTAFDGYCGTKALSRIGMEWGIETSDKEVKLSEDLSKNEIHQVVSEIMLEAKNGKLVFKRIGSTHGDISQKSQMEHAVSGIVSSIIGGIYLHRGLKDARDFINDHIISRHLSISSMFLFEQPTRELSVLCSRQKLEPPISRLIAETGRRSSAPLFVVGVYSGNEKLGEGHGSSLKEAKHRAAVDALKAWYLYESKEFDRPSKTLINDKEIYIPVHIDSGEVIV